MSMEHFEYHTVDPVEGVCLVCGEGHPPTPRPTAESPKTEAGRAFLYDNASEEWAEWMLPIVLAIEAEAAALSDSARLREALADLLSVVDHCLHEGIDYYDDDGSLVGDWQQRADEARALLALQPTTGAEPSLDAAWKAAEDALPEGVVISDLYRQQDKNDAYDGWWARAAIGWHSDEEDGPTAWVVGPYPTPTAALQALATALTKP